MGKKEFKNFVCYLKGKKLDLSDEEKVFLQSNIYDLTLENLVAWLKSDIRRMPVILCHLNEIKLSKEQLLALTKLNSFELTQAFHSYANYGNNEDLLIGLLGTAYLGKYIILDNDANTSRYNSQIIDGLVSFKTSDRLNKLELIKHSSIYHHPTLVEKIIRRDNLPTSLLELICELLDKVEPYSSDISAKLVDLMLDKVPSQIDEVDPKLKPSDISKLDKRERAKNAILQQDSFDKVKEVMYAALNNGIYRKKAIFGLIQKEKDEKKMRIMRILATHNRFRKNPYYMAMFSGLDLAQQEQILEFVGNTDRKIKHAQNKVLRKRRVENQASNNSN